MKILLKNVEIRGRQGCHLFPNLGGLVTKQQRVFFISTIILSLQPVCPFFLSNKKGGTMKKRVWLWLMCLVLLSSFVGCDAELPVSPDVHQVYFPVIDYFHAAPTQILFGEGSTLFWKAHVSAAGPFDLPLPLNVFIHWGYGESIKVESVGVTEVYPKTTTIYHLTAYVGTGKSIRSATEFVTVSVK
jgi:hypothetical protein